MQPEITDIRAQLPTANTGSMRFRDAKDIRIIAVHYDAEKRPEGAYDPVPRYVAQARYHIKKNWNNRPLPYIPGFGLMYHYRISGDGRIWRTQPEELITWQVCDANDIAMGICLDCGPSQEPTKPQLDSLKEMLNWLCYERGDIQAGRVNVWGHGELTEYGNRTACPGKILPYAQAYRANKWGQRAEDPTPPVDDKVEFIEETGYYVCRGFRDLYHQVNSAVPGLFITGYPISNEEADDIDPSLTVQYFENVRMEWRAGIQPRLGAVGRFYRELKKKGRK